MKKIVLKRKSKKIQEYNLDSLSFPITIGRSSENILIIEDEKVKLHQLLIDKVDDVYILKNLDDSQKILVNNKGIEKESALHHKDLIKFGSYEIIFYMGSSRDKKMPKTLTTEQSDNMKNDDQLDKTFHVEDLEEITKDDKSSTKLVNNFDESEVPDDVADRNGGHEKTKHVEQEIEQSEVSDQGAFDNQADMNVDFEKTKPVDQEAQLPVGGYRSEPVYFFHYLIAIYGPYKGQKYKLNFGDTKIGRDPKLNDIVINKNAKGDRDSSISRRHATIRFDDGRYLIFDKRSQLRTYVNQRELSTEEILCLQPNDEIEIVSDKKSTIFRFVREGEWNVKKPQKAGVWWLRYQTKISLVISIVAIIFSVILILNSLLKSSIINQKPSPLTIQEEVWYKAEKYPNPLPFTPNPALSDINGDGILDFILIDSQGHIIALDGKSKKRIWKDDIKSIKSISPTSITLADMNNDGLDDIIVAAHDSRVYIFNGKNGLEIHRSDFLGSILVGSPAVADLNQDGNNDVAVCTENGDLHIGLFSQDKISWNSYPCNLNTKASPTIIVNDIYKILFGTESGLIPVFNFSKGSYEEPYIDVNDNIEAFKGQIQLGKSEIRSNIAYGQVQSSRNFIFVATRQLNIIAFDETNNFQRSWYDEFKPIFFPDVYPAPVISNLSNDGQGELVFAHHSGVIKSYLSYDTQSDSKKTLWATDSTLWEATSKEQFIGNPALADLNKDNHADIIIGGVSGTFYILDGSSGDVLFRSTIQSTFSTTPVVGDIDRDGYLDILCLADNYNVYRYKTNTRIFKGTLIWKQQSNDPCHSGKLYYKLPSLTNYIINILVSILLIVLIFLLYYKEKNREKQLLANLI